VAQKRSDLPRLYKADDPRHPYAVAYLRWLAGENRRHKPTARGYNCPSGEGKDVERRVDELVRKAAARMLTERK
jgi:hypothetical protein